LILKEGWGGEAFPALAFWKPSGGQPDIQSALSRFGFFPNVALLLRI